MKNVAWIYETADCAVFTFEYSWSGLIHGKTQSGNGIGTSILVKAEGSWKLLAESLNKAANP